MNYLPSMDDINVGLESMRFSQRSNTPTINSRSTTATSITTTSSNSYNKNVQDRRYSPNDLGGLALGGGSDGAMEITGGRGTGITTSVYSLDEGLGVASEHRRGPERRESEPARLGIIPPFEQRRNSNHSASLDAFTSDSRRDSGSSFLPYDDPYTGAQQQQQQQHSQSQQHSQQQQFNQQQQYDNYSQPVSSSSSQYYSEPTQSSSSGAGGPYYSPDLNDPRNHPQHNNSYGPPANQYYSQQQHHHQQQQEQQYHHQQQYHQTQHHHQQQQHQHHQHQHHQQQQQQPSFQPQPPHGGWNFDHSQAAAQNPYYAAASGQLGFPDGSSNYGGGGNNGDPNPYRLHRAVSSASSLGSMGPNAGATLGRSGTSMASSNARKASTNGGGGGSSTNKSGPPITKSSVDEYRSRIKADPDPEAQFNFAKYLIEAAKKISSSASGDEKLAKKYRDALLAESLKLIKRLATQGTGLGKPAYADAQFFLANCLGNGSLGLQVDHEKAYNLYVQASKQNHSSATYRTAVCNEVGAGTRRDHARAVLFYRKASALGDTAGMYKLGMILLNGLLGQQRNPKDAVAWLKRAASQADEDNPHALHELGLLYERTPQPSHGILSTLVSYDPAQARELFTQAGQFGYPPSQFKLGTCYEYGSLTCPVDPRRSIAWYTRAAERGDAESELALSGWYLTGSEGVLKQSDSEAYLWARRAANKGLPKAEYAVGYYSEVGIGVKSDLEEAKRWYMRAAGKTYFLFFVLENRVLTFLLSIIFFFQLKEIRELCRD